LIRGTVILIAAPGDFGKPRPAVVVQSNFVTGTIESVIVCPLTSMMSATPRIRPTILPDLGNGLRQPSQAMTDKIIALHVRRIGREIGHLAASDIASVDRAMAFVLGLLD